MNTRRILISALCSLAFGLAACGGDNAAAAEEPVNNPFGGADQPVPTSQAVGASSAVILSSASGGGGGGQTGPVAGLAPSANTQFSTAMYKKWLEGHYVTLDKEATYYGEIADQFRHVFKEQYLPAARIVWSTTQGGGYATQCKVDESTESKMKYRGCTVSEGIGYGMLITAIQGDVAVFNTLWNYSRAFRAYNNQALTPWITFSFTYNVVDNGSATDADLDIATSLLIMYAKTGEAAYLNDALTIAAAIWDTEVKDNMLLSGDTPMWNGVKGPIVYNLSYFSPVALRLFAKYDQTHNWNGVIDAMYSYMTAIQDKGTGVFPDWSDATTAVNPPNKSAGTNANNYTWYTFNKEAVRIPWRIAWDYYWYQDTRALAVLQKLNRFIVDKAAGDPTSSALSVNYSWDLSLGPDNTRNTAVPGQWLAAWCATGLATNSDWLSKCTDALNKKEVSNTASSYFSDILMVMYSQLLNGAYVNPFK